MYIFCLLSSQTVTLTRYYVKCMFKKNPEGDVKHSWPGAFVNTERLTTEYVGTVSS